MNENLSHRSLKRGGTGLISEAQDSKNSKLNSSLITVGFFSKINCNILKSGITPLFDQYYLCECDPERRNAICSECFKICHNGPGHKEIKKFLKAKVCMCGYKGHQPMDEKDDQVQYYSKECLFGSLGLRYFYNDKNVSNSHICTFCKNLCFKNSKNLNKIKGSSFIGKINNLNINNINDNITNCNCTNHNHNDIRILFRKLRGLTKKKNFLDKYDFEGLTLVHVINLLLRDNACFTNLFYSFSFHLNEIIRKIKEESFYALEDYKFVNNFHLTCEILSSFAEKNMNIYSISHFIPEENPTILTTNTFKSHSFIGENNANNSLNVYGIKQRPLCYYRDEIGNILTTSKYFQIMMLKFDFKSRNIWQLKYSLTNIYFTFTIRKIFLPTINYKIRDMLLLSPLQRLIIVSSNKKKIENGNDKNPGILDMTINLLIKLEKTNERQNEVFCIYNRLYKICQYYAKFGFFTHAQVTRFCSVNKKILLMITENLAEDKKSQEKKNIIFKVLSPMMKTLLYLCYHFNDQMLMSYLNKERNINLVNFFHMKNEICKLTMSNVIYTLSIIQELVPDILFDNYKNDLDDSASQEEIPKKRGRMKTSLIKFQVNMHYYEDSNIKKCIRNATFAAHSIIRIILDLPDNYQSTMTRLLNSNAELLFNYLTGNIQNSKDSILLSKFQKINDDLEDNYLFNFDNYDDFYENLSQNFNQNLDILINLINESKVSDANNNEFNIKMRKDDINQKYFRNESFNINLPENKYFDFFNDYYNKINNKKIFNILINFSPLIQTIFKGAHILFYYYLCRKSSRDKNKTQNQKVSISEPSKDYFIIEQNIFNKILEISLYYIENDINNCFIFLTSDILNIIKLLNSVQLYDFLSVVEKCLIKIRDTSEELTSNTYLIQLLKICVAKSQYNLELIYKVLKIFSIILQLNLGSEKNTLKKLKKLFILYYDIFKESQIDLHSLFIDKDKENSDLASIQNIQNGLKNVSIEIKKKKDLNSDESEIEKYSSGHSFLIYNKEFAKKSKSKNIKERFFSLKNKITHKILFIINSLFEGNTSFEEKTFLECLLSKNEIKSILSKDLSLDIGIRTELLIFYRIVYLDTVLIKNNINFYMSLLINEPKVQKTEAIVENHKLLRFYQNLILNDQNNIENITEDADVIKFELLNYKGIIKSLAKNNNNKKTRNYIELGIIKPLLVYISKFSGIVFNCSGYDYLRYYELLYHYLFLKKYILEHPFLFNDIEEEEEYNENITDKSEKFFNVDNNYNKFNNKKSKFYRNPFRNKLNSLCKHRKKIIKCDFDANELKNVKEDIEKLLKLNFEVLNFSLMKNIFESSFYGFIQKERLNKGMKEVFEKTDEVYDEKNLVKIKKYLQKYSLYSTYFQQEIFEIIIHYINGKAQLEDCSFIKMLSEDNIFYNCKWRVLLIKNILFFMMNSKYENTYKEICLWEIFRLLKYNTKDTQKACLELMEKKDNPVNFEYFLQNLTLHIMNILISELNPGSGYIRYNYYMTLMIIKILKYFCEEHNQNFQRIFFMKEDDGLILHYNPNQYIQKEEENIIYFDENEEFKNSLITESDNNLNEENKENGKNLQGNAFSIFENPSTKPIPDIECEDLNEITRSDDKINEESCSKASVFEFMLSILGKIILLSGWNNSKNIVNLDDYLYDLYFVILEFLIETIQGTKMENLETVFKKDNNGKNLFGTFLNEIHGLIHEDNEEELSYQVRKDMMDFLMTFLEESSTPPIGIIEISTVILPINILENIVNTMSRLYESIKEEKNSLDDDNDNYNNFENYNTFNDKNQNQNQINNIIKKRINDNLMDDIDNYSIYQGKNNNSPYKNNLSHNEQNNNLFVSNFNNNQNKNMPNNPNTSEDNQELNKKLNYKFTPKMKKFFNNKFFNDPEFGEDIRFGLANRMYQFFKFFGIADECKNPAVTKFYEKMSKFSERSIIKNYYSSRINENLSLSDDNINNIDKKKDNSVTITNPSFYDNYLCVSFFESITRIVFVNKPGIEKPVRVLFTINPVVSLLSNVSKNDFLETVDRSDRYSKLFSLMESCDYFFEEISYKQNQAKNNFIAKFIIDLDFYWLEVFSFCLNFTINIILLSTVEGETERLYGDKNSKAIVDSLGLIYFIFNLLIIIVWIIIKFPLYYLTESHKYLKKIIKDKEEKNEDDEKMSLNIFNKIYVIYYILIKKSTLSGFLWNLVFTCAGVFSKIHFLYIVQILGIINLSQKLKNIILSLVIKLNQLSAVFYCILVFNLLFGNIAFFKFSRDFIRKIDSSVPYSYPQNLDILNDYLGSPYNEPSHVENECGTMLYCFATHLSYGMRFDGGIADRMEKASYTYDKGYYVARFFYEELYFLILVILMLNMIYGIITDAFSELRNKVEKINRDKQEVCFICGIDKETCEKKGEKFEEHLTNVHNLWIYVEYMIGLRFVDIQDTNAINSYVIESLEQKELVWFPYDETAMAGEENKGEDEN